MEMIKDIYV